MAKRYGLPYKGSKNAIAKWVIDNLPAADWFIDVFAGGCAITHAAIESGKYKHIIANDLTDTPAVFKAACEGEFEGYATVPSREQFHEQKADDRAMALLYSFGNNTETYLWGAEVEHVKAEAERMISAPSVYERRMAYKRFIRALAKYGIHGRGTDLQGLQRLQGLEGLGRLERLERLQGLQGLEGLQRLQVTKLDYHDLFLFGVPESSVVYLDPPYKGTDTTGYAPFDYAEFESWLKTLNFPVVVSEYTCPKGFEVFASKNKRVKLSSANNSRFKDELLCVQKQYINDYRQTQQTLF